MANLPENTVLIKVIKVKDKPFYATIGPGGTVLAANPMFDGVTGNKEMTGTEVYTEFERLLFLDWYDKHPEHYEEVNTYLGPPDMKMYAEIDMRSRSLEEMVQNIQGSTNP